MDIAAKNRQVANSYYNLGLERRKYGIFPVQPSA